MRNTILIQPQRFAGCHCLTPWPKNENLKSEWWSNFPRCID